MMQVPYSGVTVVPQPVEITQTKEEEKAGKNKRKIIRKLGFAELFLGICSFVFGIAIAIYLASLPVTETTIDLGFFALSTTLPDGYYRVTTGEGIWCGIWIITAGALGIAAGQKKSGNGIINAHMGFCVVASIFSGILVCIAAPFAIAASVSLDPTTATGLFSALAVIGFTSFVLLIVSAGYCCSMGQCCGNQVQHQVIIQQPTTISTSLPTATTYQHQMTNLPGQQVYYSQTPQYGFRVN